MLLEMNIDGIPGPTHHYGGIAAGNLASIRHATEASQPKKAALQSLEKMRLLSSWGIPQAFLPPHPRPDFRLLRTLGFHGAEQQMLDQCYKTAPEVLSACFSSAFMWTANAATISAATDTADGKTHITPANLLSNLHRSIEPRITQQLLKALLPESDDFIHHAPLPASHDLRDEGAANHMRLEDAAGHGAAIFVYGADACTDRGFLSRQAKLASEQIVRQHDIVAPVCFVQQKPQAINAGAFHNDVVATANGRLLLFHEHSFVQNHGLLEWLEQALTGVQVCCIPQREVALDKAVTSYLFNAQLVSVGEEQRLILPVEAAEDAAVMGAVEKRLLNDGLIASYHVMDLKQSMKNGGGPACLRLRVPLEERALKKVNANLLFSESTDRLLTNWIERYYPETLTLAELTSPGIWRTSLEAIETLYAALGID